jgi:cyclophilin family peptidyl-prolyl cis-trans isomerase
MHRTPAHVAAAACLCACRMASSGDAHSNSSQFYITLRALPFFDLKRVAFGQVVIGFEVLDLINNVRACLLLCGDGG